LTNITLFAFASCLVKIVFSGLLMLSFLASIYPASAANFQLKPHKDKLFKYRKAIKTEDNGRFVRAPYDPLRDINARDEIPVRKVKTYYTSSRPARHQQDLSFKANGRDVTYLGVGALNGYSNMTVIFVHGRDGSRHLGFSDEKFGGNFNRVKSLMYFNGGTYLSADITDFKEKGRQDVAALIKKYRPNTKGPLVVACGSMGSHICWRLANTRSSSKMIDGLVIMGGFPNDKFLQTRRNKSASKIPVYIAHGGIDYVYSWKDQMNFYRGLQKAGNPVRYVVFDGGKHGTPVRMIDWRVALNWISNN
jgi:dienelactone hydrolase